MEKICVKLQYSVICQEVQETGLEKILHGFRIGSSKEFYVVNKWIWDDLEQAEDFSLGILSFKW